MQAVRAFRECKNRKAVNLKNVGHAKLKQFDSVVRRKIAPVSRRALNLLQSARSVQWVHSMRLGIIDEE